MTRMLWTPAAETMITDLWNIKKLSGRQISVRLAIDIDFHVTRTAVIGKARRLGLTDRPRPPKKTRPSQARKTRNLHDNIVVDQITPEAIGINAIPFLESREHHCRWPVGEGTGLDLLFCGDPKLTGYSYCPRHCRVSCASAAAIARIGRPYRLSAGSRKKASIYLTSEFEPALGLSAGSEAAAGLADQGPEWVYDRPLSFL